MEMLKVMNKRNYEAIKILVKTLPENFEIDQYMDRLEEIEKEVLLKEENFKRK